MNYDQREYPDDMWDKLIDNNRKWGNDLWINMKKIKMKTMDIIFKD